MLTKKTASPVVPDFRVPGLAEAMPEYGDLIRRKIEISAALSSLAAERRTLEKEVAADRSPRIRPGVAALLGDNPVDSRSAKIARLAELKTAVSDHEIALATIDRRLATMRGPASAAVRAAVKPEYARRVAAICDALAVVDVARAAYDEIRNDLDAEDVEWSGLGVVSLGFLGDRDGGKASFHIARVMREAREAGNYA